jgi:hypothetical protein
MMKLTQKLATLLLATSSLPAIAHPGHLLNESAHGLLHAEHILPLAAAAVVIALFVIRNRR